MSSMNRQSGRGERTILTRLRQLGKERIVLPLSGGLSVSWFSLQVLLCSIGCLACLCCSVSSYLWSATGPRISVPAPSSPPRPTGRIPHPTDASEAETGSSLTPFEPSIQASPTITDHDLTPTPPASTPLPGSASQLPTPSPRPTVEPRPPEPNGTPRSSRGSPDVTIAHVEYNPLGLGPDDDQTDDARQEYIIVENQGTGDQDVTGWTLNNDQFVTYAFPAGFVLRAGASVRVWTTDGTDTDVELYWGNRESIWNNKNGVAYLRDDAATLVDYLDW
jgi:hypothetical protein